MIVDDDERVAKAARKEGFTVMAADWGTDEEAGDTLFDAQHAEGRT